MFVVDPYSYPANYAAISETRIDRHIDIAYNRPFETIDNKVVCCLGSADKYCEKKGSLVLLSTQEDLWSAMLGCSRLLQNYSPTDNEIKQMRKAFLTVELEIIVEDCANERLYKAHDIRETIIQIDITVEKHCNVHSTLCKLHFR